MEVESPGAERANGHHPSARSSSTTEPSLMVDHLLNVLEVTLGASYEDLEGAGSLWSIAKRGDTVQRCTRFASEHQVALYVRKNLAGADQANGAFQTQGIHIRKCSGMLLIDA